MGRDLFKTFPEAREVFQEVDDSLNQKLSSIMFEGDSDTLTLTENAQPALMTVSVAISRVLEKAGYSISENASYLAGHSLGEYTALCVSGSFSLADTARLLKTRGQAMQKAVPVGEGAMAAVLGLNLEIVQKITEEAALSQTCTVANDNSPGQVVVSGHKQAVERAIGLANEAGAKRSLLLPVSAPFHCPLMEPAQDVMAQALAGVEIKKPKVPIIMNVTAQPCEETEEIRERLVQQITGQVRWRESILTMKALGVQTVIEAGTGKVLTGLIKRIDKDLTALTLTTPDEIEAFVTNA